MVAAIRAYNQCLVSTANKPWADSPNPLCVLTFALQERHTSLVKQRDMVSANIAAWHGSAGCVCCRLVVLTELPVVCRANTTGGKPTAGSNVTIPFGWRLVIDESPPPLNLLLIEGAVSFSNSTNVTLTASYIVVQNTGSLSAGQPGSPHPAPATILLAGTRNTPQLAITSNLVLGAKVGWLCCHGNTP